MPSRKTDYASHIIFRISHLAKEIKEYGGRLVVLNDIATALYGLIKPVSEIRILVGDIEDERLAEIIVNGLGMTGYKDDILRSLNTIDRAVLNPLFIPITIVEKPRKPVDRVILEEPIEFVDNGIEINLPRLEYLIAKLLDIGEYPYIVDASALLLAHIDLINIDVLMNYADLSPIMDLLRNIREFTSIFPELNKHQSKISDLMEKIKDSYKTIF